MKRTMAVSILALTFSLTAFAQTQQAPVTLRSVLLQQLKNAHNQAEWYAPISVAVDGLTAEQASWQPPKGAHSAGQLTYHLLFWNRQSLMRLSGQTPDKFSGDNEQTFSKFDAKQWSDIVKQLDQVLTDMEKLVETANDQKLAAIAPTVAKIATHNAYHDGQIIYVRKLQGSWNPDKGVK
jgi:hypothetical protein